MRRLRDLLLCLAVVALPLGAMAKKPQRDDVGARGAKVDLSDYRGQARQVAREMIDRYGQPDEVTPSMLIWNDNGPWKQTIVHKDGVRHNFPAPHRDVLEQSVELDVPAASLDDLAAFDGSIVVDRTRGLVTVFGEREPMNFLALNLARDVAIGKRSPAEARKEYTASTVDILQGRSPAMSEKLRFAGDEDAGDPGKATVPKKVQRSLRR